MLDKGVKKYLDLCDFKDSNYMCQMTYLIEFGYIEILYEYSLN